MDRLAIVIVTYKRQELLGVLLNSLFELDTPPWRVYVVDNEDSKDSKEIVEEFSKRMPAGWEKDAVVYAPQATNTGGAGGFSEGVRLAYLDGAEWFWLMDDDVKVMPDVIDKLSKWADEFDCIQGSRLDFDGGSFFWQYRFIEKLGIYNPLAKPGFDESGWKPTNALCFEGGLFSRKVVEKIGFPDARFFIYWDDCVYGYLASKHFRSAVVEDVILQRTRNLKNWEVTGAKQLNSSSDMTRYHVMRNRGHMARYMKITHNYSRIGFALGTLLSFAKEFIRLISVDRKNIGSGVKSLFSGWKDSRAILKDKNWLPYWEEMPVESCTDECKA